MADDSIFLTTTMAKLYAGQGYLEKAAEIYRHLLKVSPGREDLVCGLAEIEIKKARKENTTDSGLDNLFQEWIDLLLRLKRIQKMKKLKNSLSEDIERD